MSDPVIKGLKRSPPRPSQRSSNSSASSAKNRTLIGKSAKPKPIAKRTTAEKAPARKAAKSKLAPAAKNAAKKQKRTTAAIPKASGKNVRKAKAATTTARSSRGAGRLKKVISARPKPVLAKAVKSATPQTPQPPRQPTRDEAAALRAFERAHKEFARGRFGEARSLFTALIEQYAGVAEITARARTYAAIAESRMRTGSGLPRDADSLYDRGVIELNRGEYVAAQEMFERALKREPEAAHIHYGLAATRARLGSIELALNSLERALDLQPNLRVRAQHDLDLTSLRTEPEFERLVFSHR